MTHSHTPGQDTQYEKARDRYQEHLNSDCPACLASVNEVTAPVCSIALELSRAIDTKQKGTTT